MSASLSEGTIFAGRYRVLRCIAAGGMGAVYEVAHLETERRRALKVMHPHLFQSDDMRERFKREARIAAHVESEYIVDVSDAGVDEATGTPYLVMELLRGEELGDRLKRLGRLPAGEVLTYLTQAAWALDRTHAASIVHRDLKPANLFVTQREDGSPRIKILDFGVAKLVAEGATSAGATRSLGTPLYMSPEQFRTNARLSGAADIYALGMMAFTLLVGEPYWSQEAKGAGDVIAFAMVVVRGPIESAVARARARGVMLPPAFDAWFARVTAVEPAQRYATASEAMRALREVLEPTASTGAGLLGSSTFAPGSMAVPAASTPFSIGPVPTPIGAIPSGSGAFASAGFPNPSVTSPNSSVTPPPRERSRGPLIALLGVLGLVVVGLGVGLWSELRSRPVEAPVVAAPAPPAVASVAVALSAAPPPSAPEVVASAALPPEPSAVALPSAAIASRPAPTSPPKPSTAPTAKPPAPPPTSKPTAKAPTGPLLGRD
jgi:serine/threonine-protein kinase